MKQLTLSLLPDRLAVARLAPDAPCPNWLDLSAPLSSLTRTADELSLLCADDLIPTDVQAERGFMAFKVEGPLDFSLTGILSQITAPLAAANISIFAISTFDTDYVLVREADVKKAKKVLGESFTVQG